MNDPSPIATNRKRLSPGVKFGLEMGPLLLFFFANARPNLFEPLIGPLLPRAVLVGPSVGLFVATGVLMIAVVAALAVSYAMTRRLPVMPLVTAVLVLVFGALTFYFQDDHFIKMKPTVLYACFALALGAGLVFDKPILPLVLDNAMQLTDRGWRILTLRWALFFLVLAMLNELVWRVNEAVWPDHPNDIWVAFKFPGTVVIIFLFTLSQVPLILRHEIKEGAPADAP